MFESIKSYVASSYDEMKNKVSWPAYSELQSSTVIVLVASLIFALLVGLLDFALENVMSLLYHS